MAWLFAALLQPQAAAPEAGHSSHGEEFNEGPRQKAHPMEGMGKVVFEVTTRDPEARKFFTQGVGQLHGFYYFEAERSFRQAAALDPVFAMAYWGMAMANINNEKRARGFIDKAAGLKNKASKREAAWIDALSAYYKNQDRDKRARGLIGALDAIARENPADLEARAFLAWAMWNFKDKGVPISSYEAVDALLGEVLRGEPMHPGAHHYRIHLWDDVKPERAIESVERYGPSSPGIAHAWHMPGHIYSKLARYPEAAWQQEAAARVDHAHAREDRIFPYQIHNYAHNNQWLITDLSHIGRVKDAVAMAKNLIEIPRHPKFNSISQAGSCGRQGRDRLFEVLPRWELWDELLDLSQTILKPIDPPEDKAKRLRALGKAYFAKADLERLSEAASELEKLKDSKKALEELRGYQAILAGEDPAAHFAASDMTKEDLATAYRTAGMTDHWIKAARQVGVKNQLYVAALRAEAAGNRPEELRELGRYADPDLPILRRLGWNRVPERYGPDLERFGPFLWKPVPVPEWSAGGLSRAAFAGRPYVLIFYLGSACSHCVAQINRFAAIAPEFQGISIVGVSAETPEGTSRAALSPGFPLLPDPEKNLFKLFGAWDDFENIPLHGTFLVDGAGLVRWQDISFDPFADAGFLLEEARRLLALR